MTKRQCIFLVCNVWNMSESWPQRTVLRSLLVNYDLIGVPSHNIAMYDSRLWDPEWEHRGSYRGLHRVLRYWFGDNQAATIASSESVRWRNGVRPALITLPNLANAAPDKIATRIKGVLQKLLSEKQKYIDIDLPVVIKVLQTIVDTIGDPFSDSR